MNRLLSLIDRFNAAYDRLPPGRRFGYFISAMACAVFPLELGIHLGNRTAALFGFALFSVMGLIAVVRASKLGPEHRVVGACILLGLGLLAIAL